MCTNTLITYFSSLSIKSSSSSFVFSAGQAVGGGRCIFCGKLLLDLLNLAFTLFELGAEGNHLPFISHHGLGNISQEIFDGFNHDCGLQKASVKRWVPMDKSKIWEIYLQSPYDNVFSQAIIVPLIGLNIGLFDLRTLLKIEASLWMNLWAIF